MNICTIPIRNLSRKLLRTILLVIVFTIGILSMVAINKVSKVVGSGLEKKMTQFGANILIYPVTDILHVSYGGFDLGNFSYIVKYLPESRVVKSIRNIELNKNISAVAPKLIVAENYKGQGVVFVGVDWQEELKLKSHWAITGKVPEETSGILIGSTFASHLALNLGNWVNIGEKKYLVEGVLEETGSEDDNVAFISLHQLQADYGKSDLVNYVEVSALCSGCPIEDIVMQIGAKLPDTDIKTVKSIVQQRLSAVSFVQRLAGIVSIVIVLTASFMIALFMTNSVNERKKEIGVLRSMGYSKLKIFQIFCFESLLIGIFAGTIGYISGFFTAFRVLDILRIIEDAYISFSATQFALTVTLVCAVSVFSSILPAWKAARIEPSDALVSI